MKKIFFDKTFIVLGVSVLMVLILLSYNLFREAVLFWAFTNASILLYKRNLVWVIYLLIINIFIFPTGGDFEESRLINILGFPITTEKALVIISPVFLIPKYIKKLKLPKGNLPQKILLVFRRNPILSLMGVFLILSYISMFFSPFELSKLRIALFGLGFILFFVVSKGFIYKEEIKSTLFIISIGIILLSLYALLEFPLGANIFDGSTGFRSFPTGDIYRVKSTQGLPLVLSSLINMIFPFVLIWSILVRKKYLRFIFLGGLVVLMLTQIISFTRTGWLVLIVEAPLVFFIFRKEVGGLIKKAISDYPLGTSTSMLIIFATIFYMGTTKLASSIDFRLTIDTPPATTTLETKAETKVKYVEANVSTIQSRIEGVELSRRVLKERPLIGVGLGGFSEAVSKYGSGLKTLSRFGAPDNSYTMLLTETGLLGTFSFILVLLLIIIKVAKYFFETKDAFFRKISLAVLISSLVVILQSVGFEVFSYAHTIFIFFILAGLVIAYSNTVDT